MFQASLPFFTPEARKPGQRIRSTRNDRAENQPVSDDTVEDKERKSPKVPSAQFGHNRGPQVQKVSSAAGGCLDRFDRLIDFLTEPCRKTVGNAGVVSLELSDIFRKLRVKDHPHRRAAR